MKWPLVSRRRYERELVIALVDSHKWVYYRNELRLLHKKYDALENENRRLRKRLVALRRRT